MLTKSEALDRDVSEGNMLIIDMGVTDANVFDEL